MVGGGQWLHVALDTTYLHLTSLKGVVESFPLGPVNAVGIGEVGPTKVEAIEIGEVATLKPPGA